jgi:hypothetical protein
LDRVLLGTANQGEKYYASCRFCNMELAGLESERFHNRPLLKVKISTLVTWWVWEQHRDDDQ